MFSRINVHVTGTGCLISAVNDICTYVVLIYFTEVLGLKINLPGVVSFEGIAIIIKVFFLKIPPRKSISHRP